ncbi:23S rRNA (cytidine1920-2'-O)/16S rRNA (cytidine1409-2'-O)-methyltransferase [Clostridium amylolyticum]|uniref:23S rRNA (Cytidine1920-2'-O)/16S rRNA (Cytidine1409-2'-O)-methyltransferase n=1 Tax=Clostridium amylolyticum TaxID=1121298 RepID=A0A1M6KGP0_9CLOT|nr:TlyA family RNA methyltransferase [Clostridium amylolyticum]SHJ58114.1 23S rRNA (cytidine1920-2'-O)/16S rRNA (cytidine1409-2'-O)-methyltransferase [Clostridium amylolyticum]
MTSKKIRLDQLLVEKGLFQSRERAKAAVMSGKVYVDDIKVDKCGEKVHEDAKVEYRGEQMPYVSRGGFKLEKAINSFDISLNNKVSMDIGSSTGGFTDCMLQNGASKVYSIDVGYGQLAWKLRIDPRVVCMERTNIRYVTPNDIEELAQFASIDVSFISLTTVIPPILELLEPEGEIVALIKPQFEAGREKVGKKGVVREEKTHVEVINKIVDFLEKNNLTIKGIDYSPIKGPEGNIEYLIYFSKIYDPLKIFSRDIIDNLVRASHEGLNN